MLDTSGAAQINNTEGVNGSSGQGNSTQMSTGANPFINSVFTQPRSAAQGPNHFESVLPKGAGGNLLLNC